MGGDGVGSNACTCSSFSAMSYIDKINTDIIYFFTCRFALSAAVLVVLKIVPVLLRLLVSVCRGACGLW